ncbi:MAG: hypothetical protein KC572_05915 [Gammaproteobacteria bacterium]|nr:hypothetical protein [Gammaproteobacteria bacterium]
MRSFKLLIVVTCAALTAEPVRSAPSETRITPPGATVIVEFAERVDDAVSRDLLDWIDHVADQVSMPYGRFPLATTRVVIIPTEERTSSGRSPVPFGRVTRRGGETIELYVDVDRPIADMYADWTATHEFSHLLLPKISWRQKWISEGFASYYQNVLMARAGQYSQAQAVRKLSQGFDRGRGSRPELSPNQAAEEGVRYARYKIYWSGAAIALLADLRLRSRSDGKESLDTVLGRFQQCCLQSKKRWSGIQFFTRLDSLIDEPVFMPLYREHADTPGFPDTNNALSHPLLHEQVLGVRTSPN